MRFAAPPSTFKTISYRRQSEEDTFLVKPASPTMRGPRLRREASERISYLVKRRIESVNIFVREIQDTLHEILATGREQLIS